MRAVFHAADEASVATRANYFLRSIAAIRVARGVWLYGGAMIGTLTAMRILSEDQAHPLLEKLLYIVGPSLIGFIGYSALRQRMNGFLAQAPAVRRLVLARTESALVEQRRATWRFSSACPALPVGQIAVPLGALAVPLWTGSGLRGGPAPAHPVTTKGLVGRPALSAVGAVLLGRDYVKSGACAEPNAETRSGLGCRCGFFLQAPTVGAWAHAQSRWNATLSGKGW